MNTKEKTSNLNVHIRIRPVLQREINNNSFIQCLASKNNKIYISKTNKPLIIREDIESNIDVDCFTFDTIFDKISNQEDIFNTVGIPSIKCILEGYNSTIFAYGQTGSGKTYTIEGNEDNPGLLPRIIKNIFNVIINDENYKITMSAIQIYFEQISDLIDDEKSKKEIKILKKENGFECSNLEEIILNSPEESLNIFKKAQKKRIVASTIMNDISSRGHVVYMLKIYKKEENSDYFLFSKFNLVDLAGSERITKSGTTGINLKESIFINKSLYTLQNVVDALTNPKSPQYGLPPFRESKLTMILSNSLGGNCITTLIGCISPSLTEVNESISTLKFASSCKKILNKPQNNNLKERLMLKKRLYGENYKEKENKKDKVKEIPWKNFEYNYSYNYINTEYGKIYYIENNLPEKTYKKIIILLHACPSSSEEFIPWFQSLTYYNYKIIAIDQPGYGLTEGKPHKCNSLYNLDKGGPCDIVLAVMKELKIKEKVIVGGFDWGGGIAISLGTKYPKLFEKIIAYMPNYAEPTGNELKCLSVPILILWLDLDQMHNWNKWKNLAAKIPESMKKIEIIKMKFKKSKQNCNNNMSLIDIIMRHIVIFLGEVDPLLDKEELIEPVKKFENDTKGKQVLANINLNFVEDKNTANLINKNENLDIKLYRQSALSFKEAFNKFGENIYKEYLNNNQEIKSLFIKLPSITEDTLQKNPNFLVQIGVWEQIPKNIDKMWTSPTYFKGRRVNIKIPCSPYRVLNKKLNKDFLVYNKNLERTYLSPYGKIVDYDSNKKTFIIETKGVDNILYNLSFPSSEIFLWNSGQVFAKDLLNKIILEDRIRADYTDPIVKAKIMEISLKLNEIIKKMDFNDTNEIISLQKEAIITIRKSLNLISFYKGVNKDRYGRTDCIGKLGIYGQAQCHGLSSTICGYLLPFCDILGIEILYRGGISFINSLNAFNNKDKDIKNIKICNGENHQWVEVNLKPSMKAFVIDLWYQEAFNDDKFLFVDIIEAFNKISYANSKLLLNNSVKENEDYKF